MMVAILVLAPRIVQEPEGELRLRPALRRELAERVVAAYPEETCGLLIGRAGGGSVEAVRVIQARNLNRDRAGDRYELDPDDFVAADDQARLQGCEIVAVWHSHPDCPARPSRTDREAAWEGYSYLIVGVTAAGETDFHSWRLTGDRFLEERIVPEPPPASAPELRPDDPLKEEKP